MEVTRRYEAGVALGILLAAGAWLLAQPVLFLGAAGIGASLLVQQYRFMHDVLATTDQLSLTRSMSQSRVMTDDNTSIVFQATLPGPSSLTVTAESPPPVTATSENPEDRRLRLDHGMTDAATTFSVHWPVAGRFDWGPPDVTLSDRAGLFRSTLSMGESTSVTVVPRRPRRLHVGAGGTSIPTAFGEHKTGDRGVGLDPAEIRPYVPGDTVRQIDWKATARAGHPHVREFDAETDLSISLVVDHRSPMAMGANGETKLDYLRQVALAYADNARSNKEPISLYSVGDEGVTTTLRSDTNTRHYSRVETALHDLNSTRSTQESANVDRGGSSQTPREARAMAACLRTDDSAFGRTLTPYLAESTGYVQRIEKDPLYRTVQTYFGRNRGSVITVLLTDDTHRMEIRETVRSARRQSEQVLVFLAPSVLFERGGLRTIETAYDGYVDFEEFRRELAQIEGVTAFEVGPADRIEAILAETHHAGQTPVGGL